jgi:hypothetical protein
MTTSAEQWCARCRSHNGIAAAIVDNHDHIAVPAGRIDSIPMPQHDGDPCQATGCRHRG